MKAGAFLLLFLLVLGLFGNFMPQTQCLTLANSEVDTVEGNSNIVNLLHQTKTFVGVAGRIWVFYAEGITDSHIYYKTSLDGSIWSERNTLLTHLYITGEAFSIAYDGTNFNFACWDDPNPNTLFRQGTPQTDGTIAWATDWQAIEGLENQGQTDIHVDSDGFPWIIIKNGTEVITVYKSSTKNGTWTTASGFPYYFEDGSDCDLLPLSEGKMYIFRMGNPLNVLTGTLWDGLSWGSNETLVSNDAPSDPPYLWAGYSAFAINDDIYVAAYVSPDANWNTTQIVMRKRTYGVGWGNFYSVTPVITDDSISRRPIACNLYNAEVFWVFWVENSKIMYRRGTPENWGDTNSKLLTESESEINILNFNFAFNKTTICLVYGLYISSNTIKIAVINSFFQSETLESYNDQLITNNNPYIQDATDIITSLVYASNTLSLTVSAASCTIITTKVYCGDLQKTKSVRGLHSTGTWTYDDNTKILSLTDTHSSSLTFTVSWSGSASGKYALTVQVSANLFPCSAVVQIQNVNQTTDLLGRTHWLLPYGSYDLQAYYGEQKQSMTVMLNEDKTVGFNFTVLPKPPNFTPLILILVVIVAGLMVYLFFSRRH